MSKDLTKEQEQELYSKLGGILSTTKLDDVTEDSAGFVDLPEGYFLSELKTAVLTLSSKGDPMVRFGFKVVEDGSSLDDVSTKVAKTKGLTFNKFYVLKDEATVKRLASDGMKFDLGDGVSIPKEAFMGVDTLKDALSLIEGKYIYVQNTVTVKDDGSKSSFINLISWKRAGDLELSVN